jgi:hypothetical protein
MRTLRWGGGFLLMLTLAGHLGCGTSSPSPAAPPAPPTEVPVPAFLTLPTSVTIGAAELAPGTSGSALKTQEFSSDFKDEIENVVGVVEEQNVILDAALLAFKDQQIPVAPDVTTYTLNIPSGPLAGTMKLDFRPFTFNGVQSCSGCTCPTDCAPNISVCPKLAPESDLKPLCVRIWHNDRRFAAGVLDRVPTPENQESGRMIVTMVSPLDLDGSFFLFDYDRHDPENKSIDIASFRTDVDIPKPHEFFARVRTNAQEQGPAASAKKTFQLSDEFFGFSPDSLFQGQAQFFIGQDPLLLEIIASGFFAGLDDVTPPVCASTSSATSLPADICNDLGLSLTTGNFPTLPELSDVQLPPLSEFPETPSF